MTTPEEITRIEQEIVLTLKNIYDPEIPVNIYDLGLVYEIDVEPDGVANIRMTLTARWPTNCSKRYTTMWRKSKASLP